METFYLIDQGLRWTKTIITINEKRKVKGNKWNTKKINSANTHILNLSFRHCIFITWNQNELLIRRRSGPHRSRPWTQHSWSCPGKCPDLGTSWCSPRGTGTSPSPLPGPCPSEGLLEKSTDHREILGLDWIRGWTRDTWNVLLAWELCRLQQEPEKIFHEKCKLIPWELM